MHKSTYQPNQHLKSRWKKATNKLFFLYLKYQSTSNASSQITNSFISIHNSFLKNNFLIQNQMEQKILSLNLLCCWWKFSFFLCARLLVQVMERHFKKKSSEDILRFSAKTLWKFGGLSILLLFFFNSLKHATQLSNSTGSHGQTVLNVLEDYALFFLSQIHEPFWEQSSFLFL